MTKLYAKSLSHIMLWYLVSKLCKYCCQHSQSSAVVLGLDLSTEYIIIVVMETLSLKWSLVYCDLINTLVGNWQKVHWLLKTYCRSNCFISLCSSSLICKNSYSFIDVLVLPLMLKNIALEILKFVHDSFVLISCHLSNPFQCIRHITEANHFPDPFNFK